MGVEVLWATSNSRAGRRRRSSSSRAKSRAEDRDAVIVEPGKSDDRHAQQQKTAAAANEAVPEKEEDGALYNKWWGDREESLLHPLQGLLGSTVTAIRSFLDRVGTSDAANAASKVPGAIVSSAGAAAVDHHRLLVPRVLDELKRSETIVVRCRSCDIHTLEDVVSVAVRQIHSQISHESANRPSAVVSVLKQVRDWAEFWRWLGGAVASATTGFDCQQPLVFLLEDTESFAASILDDLVRVLGEAFPPGQALVPIALVMFTAQTIAALEDQLFSTTIARLDVEEIVAPLGEQALSHWLKALALGCATFPLSVSSKTLCSVMRAYHDGFQTVSAAMHVLSLTAAAHFDALSSGDDADTRAVLKFLVDHPTVGVDDLAKLEKTERGVILGVQKTLLKLWMRNFGVLILVELIGQLAEEACELARAGNDASGGGGEGGGREAPGMDILVCSLFSPGYLDVTSNFRYITQVKGAKAAADICQKAVEASQSYSKSLAEQRRSGLFQHLLESSDKSVEALQERIGHMGKGDVKNADSNSDFTTEPSPVAVSRMIPLRNNRVSSRAMEAALSASNRESQQNCPPVNGGNSDPKPSAMENFEKILDTLYSMIEGVSGSSTRRLQMVLELGGVGEDTIVEKVHSQIFPSPQSVLRQQLELGQLSDIAGASDLHKTSFGSVGDCTILYNIMKNKGNIVCLKTSFLEFVQSYRNAAEKRGSSKRRKQDIDGLQVRFFGALFELQHIGLLSRSRKVDSVKMLALDY